VAGSRASALRLAAVAYDSFRFTAELLASEGM